MKTSVFIIFFVAAFVGCMAAPKPEPQGVFDHNVLRNVIHPLDYYHRSYDPYYYNPLYRGLPYYGHDFLHHYAPEPYFEPAAGRYVYPGLALTKEKEEKMEEKKEEKHE